MKLTYEAEAGLHYPLDPVWFYRSRPASYLALFQKQITGSEVRRSDFVDAFRGHATGSGSESGMVAVCYRLGNTSVFLWKKGLCPQ